MPMKPAVYIYADPHFGHDAIIRMCDRRTNGRPFRDAREMDEVLIESYRAVVRPEDVVFILGDFSHRLDHAQNRKYFEALPGTKHLLIGNHDGASTRSLPWASQRDIAFVSIESQNVVLSHYAMRQWPKIRKGALMLYGHSHGRLPGNVQSCDVGVDVFGWAPVRLSTIKRHLATLPLMVDPEAQNDIEDLGNGGLTL